MQKEKKREITKLPSAGRIITSILRGNRMVMEIANDLKMSHPTVIEQLAPLEKEEWIDRANDKYSVNVNRLLDYWVKEFKIDRALLKENMMIWLSMFARSGMTATIDALGVYMKINAGISKAFLKKNLSFEQAIKDATTGAKQLAKKYPNK